MRIGGQAAEVAVLVVGGMLLARLLRPEDFGLFAMVWSFLGFVLAVRDFGLPLAAVHRRSLRHDQASRLYWVAVALSILSGLLVAALAPVLAWFYGEPRLVAPTLVMAAGVSFAGMGVLHEGLLARRMRFGHLTLVSVGAALAGLLVGITSASLGAGYWALVHQWVAVVTVRTLGVWTASGWRPARPGTGGSDDSGSGIGEMLSYGSFYAGHRILDYVGRNLDRVLVGYFVGANGMGLYDNSFRWARYPKKLLSAPLLQVAVSGLSRVQDDPEAYRDSCRRGLLPVFALLLPLLAFIAVDARNVILVLLGARWIEAVPLFRLLSVAFIARTATSVTHWLYLSRGETRRLFEWDLISSPILIAAVATGVRWGAEGVAVAFTAASWLLAYPAVRFCLRTSPLSPRDFGRIVWRPALASAGAAVPVAVLDLSWGTEAPLLAMSTALVLFGAVYGVLWVALPGRRRAIAELRTVARSIRAGATGLVPGLPTS